MELRELIAGVGLSVQQAQAALEDAALRQYLDYFLPSEGGDAVRTPRIPRTVLLSHPGGQGESPLEVPLVALCSHNTMRLEQVRVRLNVAPSAEDGHPLKVSPAPLEENGNTIELLFQCGSPSEGIARINDNASQSI